MTVSTSDEVLTHEAADHPSGVPVVDLSAAPGKREAWDRPRWVVYLWAICERLIVTNAWQPSSRVRVAALRMFGAQIGDGVLFRPRTRVLFPWKLIVGDHSWIGEGVWIHNQDRVTVGSNAVISQETFITTGTHALRTNMALLTRPVLIDDGAWITSRCVVTGGARVGRSAVVAPLSAVGGAIPPGEIWRGNPAARVGVRFPDEK